ncbi:putative fatty-acid--CoA ligase FadD10, partial [Cladochytrium tenue]
MLLRDVRSIEAVPPITFSDDELENKPAYLCYSSGTTGRPKGVITTHRNMVANILQYEAAHTADGTVIEDDCTIAVLPMYHIYGLYIFAHVKLYGLGKNVVMPKFDFLAYLKYLAKYQVTTAFLVPPIILALAKHPAVEGVKLPHLRIMISAAAPLTSDLAKEARQRFPH